MIAAWADVATSVGDGFSSVQDTIRSLNIGYVWMLANCIVSAAYVR
jgi:hypothetical protein